MIITAMLLAAAAPEPRLPTAEFLIGEWTAEGTQEQACGSEDSVVYHPNGEVTAASEAGTWRLSGTELRITFEGEHHVQRIRRIASDAHGATIGGRETVMRRCPPNDYVVFRTR